MAEAGHDVSYLVPDADGTSLFGVRRISLGKFSNRRKRMISGPLRVARHVRAAKPDVVHLHDPELVPVAWALRLLTTCRIVIDVHEDLRLQVLSKPWIPRLWRPLVALVAVLIDLTASHVAHRIVVATPAIAKRFPKRKTVIVHNFPRPDEWPDVQPLPWRERTEELLFVGGLTEIRGARTVLDAMMEPPLSSHRLLIVGKLDQAVERLLAGHPARPRVTVTGWMARADMAPILARRGRIGLVLFRPVPNHTEALPNKLFEYMAWGQPIVASDFPLWKEILTVSGAGIVADPTSPRGAAEAIGGILSQPEVASAMAAAGQKSIRIRFGWEHEGAVLVDMYSEL